MEALLRGENLAQNDSVASRAVIDAIGDGDEAVNDYYNETNNDLSVSYMRSRTRERSFMSSAGAMPSTGLLRGGMSEFNVDDDDMAMFSDDDRDTVVDRNLFSDGDVPNDI